MMILHIAPINTLNHSHNLLKASKNEWRQVHCELIRDIISISIVAKCAGDKHEYWYVFMCYTVQCMCHRILYAETNSHHTA